MPRAGLSLLQYLENGRREFSSPIYRTSSVTPQYFPVSLGSLTETSNLEMNFTNNTVAATFEFKSASLRLAEILRPYGCDGKPLWLMMVPVLSSSCFYYTFLYFLYIMYLKEI